jgi:pyridoxal 5'-phosphate synthase pdxT subunit
VPRIGVIAMQGDFEAHIKAVESAGGEAFPAKTPEQIAAADGLILPGGESTTIGKLLTRYGLDTAIQNAAKMGTPVYGTCAGMILLAKRIVEGEKQGGQPTLGLMDIAVARNAFGRQVDSFEANIAAPAVAGEETVRGVFIRAPLVAETGPEVEVLARYDDRIVLVRQGNLLASAFHPELTDDDRLHRYFLRIVAETAGTDK